MSTGATKDWRRAFGIHNWKPPSYFASKAEIDAVGSAAPQSHALRRAFDLLSVDGILCLHNNPVIYFKEVASIKPDQVAALHKQFWNQGLAPILVLIDERDVHVYSGLTRPVADAPMLDTDDRLVQRLNRVADAAAIRQFVLSIESGDFFRANAKAFDPKQRVDRDLLRNLQATRTALAAARTRNRMLVKAGVTIRRVFIVTEEDKNDPEFQRIMTAQQQTFEEFQQSCPKKPGEKYDRYYCGVVERSEEQRQEMLSKGHHFGLWAKGGQELLVVPYYTSRLGPIAGVRFWACPPGNTNDRRKEFNGLLDESTPISAWMLSRCNIVVPSSEAETKSKAK